MIDRSSTFQNIYSYGTVNSIFVEIQPDSTNIKNDPRILGKKKRNVTYEKDKHCVLNERLQNSIYVLTIETCGMPKCDRIVTS